MKLQLAPGVFVAWGGDDPRVGHVDRPFDLFDARFDVMDAIAAQFDMLTSAHDEDADRDAV